MQPRRQLLPQLPSAVSCLCHYFTPPWRSMRERCLHTLDRFRDHHPRQVVIGAASTASPPPSHSMREGRPPHIDCCPGRRARSVITTTHWFRMPLSKVKDLTNILIDHGYIILLRTYRRHAVFCERLELLVMSALYLLGLGAAFCSCKPLCGISTSGVQKFFYTFIEALVDMKDEYIRLPWNLTDLKCVNKDYNATEL